MSAQTLKDGFYRVWYRKPKPKRSHYGPHLVWIFNGQPHLAVIAGKPPIPKFLPAMPIRKDLGDRYLLLKDVT